MALARRSNHYSTGGAERYIWPGFVDALATLLMVIIFVLMVFFLIQINLAQRVSGQDATLEILRGEIATLGELLNLAQADNAALEGRLALALDQAKQSDEQLKAAQDAISQNEQIIVGLNAQIEELTRSRDAETEARLAAEDQTRASKREVAILNESLLSLRQRLGQLQALLDEEEEKARLANEVSVNLTHQLNDALSSKVIELQKFRSEFFGRLRDILKDRSDITIVGDRFVFQAEVLFAPGSAEIGVEGEAQLKIVSTALLEIADTIPTDIDWILQVVGHTDQNPINTPRFRDNWDLSTERALSVVRYLVLAGLDPDRLSAAGFGEHHPIATGTSPQSLAQNRRIELKITKR